MRWRTRSRPVRRRRPVATESALSRQEGGGHYKDLPIQPIVYAYHNRLGPHELLVLRYITRHRNKGGAKDIRKAIHSLEMLLEMEYPEA